MIYKKIKSFISDKKYRFMIFNRYGFYNKLSDKEFIKKAFKVRVGYDCNLDNPQSFNEKLNFLKLNDHNPNYTKMVDKFEAKRYVANLIGEEYIVPTFGVFEKFDEINFELLPDQFVLKCTHDSGSVIICKDKSTFNRAKAKKFLEQHLKRNCYYSSREWGYKNVKPRIIIEKYIQETNESAGGSLIDYKFWCFNGVPRFVYVTVKNNQIFENFYDMNFIPVMINHGFPRHLPEFSKPNNFEKMKRFASLLSEGIPFVRCDFSNADEKLYFEEITLYDWGGMVPFCDDWDEKLGKLITLPV